MSKSYFCAMLVFACLPMACEQHPVAAPAPRDYLEGTAEPDRIAESGGKHTTIREVLERKMEFQQNRVVLTGIVLGRTDPPPAPGDDPNQAPVTTTTGFKLRSLLLPDQTSEPWVIKVMSTPYGTPPINAKITILGTVYVSDNEPPILQQEVWPQSAALAQTASVVPWGLICAIGGSVLVLIVLLLFLFRGRTASVGGVAAMPGFEGAWDQPAVEYPNESGATIRLERRQDSVTTTFEPPPLTLRLAPGRFKIVGGETTQEIRLFYPPNGGTVRRTFGRGEGQDPISHVQFHSPSVSRDQAEAQVENGRCFLINRSATNPTLLNDVEMRVGERLELAEGARIEMGEVELVYHTS